MTLFLVTFRATVMQLLF